MLNKIKEMRKYDKMEQELFEEIKEQFKAEGKTTLNDWDLAKELAKETVEKMKEENKMDINIKDTAKKLVNLCGKATKVGGAIQIGVGTARAIAAIVISAQMGAGVAVAASVAAEHGLKLMVKGIKKGVIGKTVEKLTERD